MHFIKKSINYIFNVFNELDLNCKFLSILGLLSFIAISGSIFNPYLDATDNLVTIRTGFSSVIGYFLQRSSSSRKTILLGILALLMMIVIVFSYFFKVSVDNPSLILLKNLFFSLIGYLTGTVANNSNK